MSKDEVPRVSVVVPAYNVENYIEGCLRSLCAQSEKSLEILVVDDGSKDRTGERVERLAAGDSRIRYIRQENGGASRARNRGLDEARGRYVAVQDADDYSHPERLKAQADFLDANPTIGVVGMNARLVLGRSRFGGVVAPPTKVGDVRTRAQVKMAFVHPSVMLRGELVAGGLRYDPTIVSAEDQDFLARAIALTDGTSLPLPLYFYRVGGDQLTVRHVVDGVMRSAWLSHARVHSLEKGAGLERLRARSTRDEALGLGIPAKTLDGEIAARFEYVLRLTSMAGNRDAIAGLVAQVRSYAADIVDPAMKARFDALELVYGRALHLRASGAIVREVSALIKREARYRLHVAKTNIECRKWNYNPDDIV